MADLPKPDIGELIRKGLIQPQMRNVRAKQTFDSAWSNASDFSKKKFIDAVKRNNNKDISKANHDLFKSAQQRLDYKDPEKKAKRNIGRRKLALSKRKTRRTTATLPDGTKIVVKGGGTLGPMGKAVNKLSAHGSFKSLVERLWSRELRGNTGNEKKDKATGRRLARKKFASLSRGQQISELAKVARIQEVRDKKIISELGKKDPNIDKISSEIHRHHTIEAKHAGARTVPVDARWHLGYFHSGSRGAIDPSSRLQRRLKSIGIMDYGGLRPPSAKHPTGRVPPYLQMDKSKGFYLTPEQQLYIEYGTPESNTKEYVDKMSKGNRNKGVKIPESIKKIISQGGFGKVGVLAALAGGGTALGLGGLLATEEGRAKAMETLALLGVPQEKMFETMYKLQGRGEWEGDRRIDAGDIVQNAMGQDWMSKHPNLYAGISTASDLILDPINVVGGGLLKAGASGLRKLRNIWGN